MPLSVYLFGALVVLGIVVWMVLVGQTDQISRLKVEVVDLKRQLDSKDAKLAAEAGRIQRRDEAIKASKCADEINDWVRHPEKLPSPYDPFNRN